MEEQINYYVDRIMNFAKNNPDTEENSKKLSKLIIEYEKFCYDNNIESFNRFAYKKGYSNLQDMSYIIESKPNIFELDEQEVSNAWNHLQEVLTSGGGISEEEANLLLDWSVQQARKVLNRNNNILTDSLSGFCGYSQMLTLIAFTKAGVKTTINNTSNFNDKCGRHAFGTVTFPIEKDGKVIKKQYLVDATYRQFFTTARCNEGRYYSTRNKDNVGPDAGYYMINYLDGKDIASIILKTGHIELTPEVLLKYASGFTAERLNINNKNQIYQILKQLKFEDLKRILDEKQEEFDYNEDEIEEALEKVDFPSQVYKI